MFTPTVVGNALTHLVDVVCYCGVVGGNRYPTVLKRMFATPEGHEWLQGISDSWVGTKSVKETFDLRSITGDGGCRHWSYSTRRLCWSRTCHLCTIISLESAWDISDWIRYRLSWGTERWFKAVWNWSLKNWETVREIALRSPHWLSSPAIPSDDGCSWQGDAGLSPWVRQNTAHVRIKTDIHHGHRETAIDYQVNIWAKEMLNCWICHRRYRPCT